MPNAEQAHVLFGIRDVSASRVDAQRD